MELVPGLKYVGKIGGRVYYYRNGVLISRPYYKPLQPVTPSRAIIWEKFRTGVNAWQALTPAEKRAWQKEADQFNYEGFNRFMSKHLKSS
jgi:hypothetical protein